MAQPAPESLDIRSVKPCLAELLRTCVHPPTLLLQVEHVFRPADNDCSRTHLTTTRDQSRETTQNNQDTENEAQHPTPLCVRLALSDGKLQIQAVLATSLHTNELLELRRGDLLEVKKFQVRKAPRVNGHGKVVYLGIEACEWVGTTVEVADEELGGGFILEEDHDQIFEKEEDLPAEYNFLSRANRPDSTDEGECEYGTKEATASTKHVINSTATRTLSMGRKRPRGPQDNASNSSKRRPQDPRQAFSKPLATPARPKVRFATPGNDSDDSDDDDFETIITSPSTIQQRREVLRNVSRNTPSRVVTTPKSFQLSDRKGTGGDFLGDSAPTSPEKETAKTREKDQESGVGLPAGNISAHPVIGAVEAPSSSTASTHDPPHSTGTALPQLHPPAPSALPSEAPVHTLATLLHSPTLPRRNYTCSVFGVITWISPSVIHKPGSPFPPKRHVKIHDPSISARRVGVTLAVYVDAKEFLSEVGTIALFRGVTMQRWEGEVILNAYANLKDGVEEWFVSDGGRLEEMGFDVSEMKRWWAQRKQRQAAGSSEE